MIIIIIITIIIIVVVVVTAVILIRTTANKMLSYRRETALQGAKKSSSGIYGRWLICCDKLTAFNAL